MRKILGTVAPVVALLSGFFVFALCIQPRDGGENGGLHGIGGLSALITFTYLAASAYLIMEKSTALDTLKSEYKTLDDYKDKLQDKLGDQIKK